MMSVRDREAAMTSPPTKIVDHVRAALGPGQDGPTDAALLARFAAQRDEGAFELLVWRHAGTVLRVCRAVLHDHHAAEDAGQAVFLALARQAGSVGRRGTVAGWLYRVARRIAGRAAARRRVTGPTADLDRVPGPVVTGDSESGRLLHEELDRLPDRYRAPVLLCFFDGLSHADAARRLGWPVGTVAGRLARAKARLHRRLTRCGVTVPAVGVAALVGTLTVPASFAGPVARAAVGFAGRATQVSGISPAVLAMAKTEIRSMIATKIQWAAGVLTVGGALALGGVWATGQDRPGSGPPAGVPKTGTEPPGKQTDDQAALAAQLAENRKLIEQFELLAREHAELQAMVNRTTTDAKRARDDGQRLKRLVDEVLQPMNEKIRREHGLTASQSIPKDPAAAKGPAKVGAADAEREAKALEGAWVVVALEANGRKATPEEVKGMRWTVRGGEVTATDPDGGTDKLSIRLDPGKSPKEIDLVALGGPNKGQTAAGIYQLDDGKLRICLRDSGGPGGRPKEFVSGPGQGLITFERAK
jgi:RNA polymerase sigma factor (sigma-70 family)